MAVAIHRLPVDAQPGLPRIDVDAEPVLASRVDPEPRRKGEREALGTQRFESIHQGGRPGTARDERHDSPLCGAHLRGAVPEKREGPHGTATPGSGQAGSEVRRTGGGVHEGEVGIASRRPGNE
jgi:hypothetical protein